jgi:hypothetical protein
MEHRSTAVPQELYRYLLSHIDMMSHYHDDHTSSTLTHSHSESMTRPTISPTHVSKQS